jgi:glucose-1-phosphate cytidylyltransferase
VKVVIFCGGLGTRIRGISDDLPKPMLPIGNRPILWHIMKSYADQGHKDFVLCLGYKGDVIRDYFLNYRTKSNDITINLGSHDEITFHGDNQNDDWTVTLVETGENTQTGGRLVIAKKYLIANERFLLTYGDGLSSVKIDDLVAFHQQNEQIVTVTGVHPPGRFGEIEADQNGVVTGFNEKPQTSSGRISGGYFVCDYAVFDFINEDKTMVFEEEPIRKLVEQKKLGVFEYDGFWQCMDTARDWNYLNDIYAKGQVPWMHS